MITIFRRLLSKLRSAGSGRFLYIHCDILSAFLDSCSGGILWDIHLGIISLSHDIMSCLILFPIQKDAPTLTPYQEHNCASPVAADPPR